jgi:hypothetical protein
MVRYYPSGAFFTRIESRHAEVGNPGGRAAASLYQQTQQTGRKLSSLYVTLESSLRKREDTSGC